MRNHPYGNFTKTQVKTWIQGILDKNDLAVCKALTVIYTYQTEYEKQAETTSEYNTVGFSGVDAEILTSFAKQFEARGFLSPKQMVIARKKMKKYWNQLWKEVVKKGNVPTSLPKSN